MTRHTAQKNSASPAAPKEDHRAPRSARFTPGLFAHAEALLTSLLRFAHPADATVSHYFREHRQLGHADRAFVAESVYAVLRRWRSLEARCQAGGARVTPRGLLLVMLATVRGWSQRELAPVLKASRRISREHPIEQVGDRLRGMMPWIKANRLVDTSKN